MEFTIFLDLDGVLVDFNSGVKKLTGFEPEDQPPSKMWKILASTPDFYNTLEWMPDGKELFNHLRPSQPVILTGLPRGNWAEKQKRLWCLRELGSDITVITCWSREKHLAAHAWLETHTHGTPILIDDRASLQDAWESIGGIFIHHHDTESTLSELQKYRL